ncbi:uncharacterized protein B0H18DRAFT_952529 [Fomitopsis serialis]|uniref:uncharacterized protein n=1 Tax=Fomitopsis serialis TaxID=139415 RepID=UPI00200831F5|nr:uncharacterized protein B0H18DRAFT_952529 [Neoantrodia serialis]KAH9931855.1 hypothetical protein B0H18DRAFT_952529 [Neoantrodia serialis]
MGNENEPLTNAAYNDHQYLSVVATIRHSSNVELYGWSSQSKTCQRKDWGHHKLECTRLRHIQQTPADANLLHDVNAWFGNNPSVTDLVASVIRSTGLPDARKKFAFHMVVEHNPMQTRKCDRIRVASHALVSWDDLPAVGFGKKFASEMQAQRDRMERMAGSVQPYVVLLAVQVINPRMLFGIPYHIDRPMV